MTAEQPISDDPDRPTVLVSSRSFSSGELDLVATLRAAGLRAVRVPTDHHPDALLPALATASAWIAGTAPVTADHLAAAPHLKVIARYGVGTDAVDLVACGRAGVLVTNTPGANSEAVSEHALALVFAAVRGVADGDARVRGGDWTVRRGRQVSGSVAGVVGFGRIGQGTARRLTALGCQVLVHDPFLDERHITETGCQATGLAELRRRSDIVSLHAPGGAVLVDREWLTDCRARQLIVNTARADLVDEQQLAAAVRDGRLSGYAADTLGSEGRTGESSPLLAADLSDRVTITPHLGAQTTQAIELMGSMATDDVVAVLAGRPARYPVTLPQPVTAEQAGGRG